MKLVTAVREIQSAADEHRRSGKRIGLVPTMGALHEGHLSLVRLARKHADIVITSVFVNPTQFAPGEDYLKYPRDLQRDSGLVASAGSDILFAPDAQELYPEGYQTFVGVGGLAENLEGKSRPNHFRGVATIVTKLFVCTKPHIAVFGEKDAQQLRIIRRMSRDLGFDIEIIPGPIVRERDGLAMSSRNVYLSAAERAESTVLYQSLTLAETLIRKGEKDSSVLIARIRECISSKPSARIDYISVADSNTLEEMNTLQEGKEILVLLAVRFGTTRLIDNCTIIP